MTILDNFNEQDETTREWVSNLVSNAHKHGREAQSTKLIEEMGEVLIEHSSISCGPIHLFDLNNYKNEICDMVNVALQVLYLLDLKNPETDKSIDILSSKMSRQMLRNDKRQPNEDGVFF